jgi:hypothetical protein
MTETTTEQPAIEAGDTGESALELLPPRRPGDMAAFGTLRQHVEAMEQAYQLAEGMCRSEIVPLRFRGKPRDATAAILFGAEVGLSPIASLRSVIVIHGQPGFEARTMKAICKSNGYRFRTIEKTATRAEIWAWEPDSPVILGADPDDKKHYGKRISPDEEAVWTFDDAVQAGFVPTPDPTQPGGYALNKNGKLQGNMKYIETPKVMLDAKVTAEVCRSIAPHLLLGLPYAAEELDELVDALADADPVRREPARGRGVDSLRDRAAASRAAHESAVDAEVVEDGDEQQEPAESDNPEKPIQPDVTPDAPQDTPSSQPIVTSEEDVTGEDLPGPGAEQSFLDDVEMSAADRTKGLAMLHGLLINGGFGGVEPDEQFAALAEIAAKRTEYRPLAGDADLSNADLKYVVNTLREWKTKGKLTDWLGEAFNQASLREAGMLENGEQ